MTASPPLVDVRVVDLTDAYGAFAARLLGELGAEVVRFEPSDGGRGRRRAPRSGDGTSLHHVHRNAGKIVPRSPANDDDVERALAGADVVFLSDGATHPAHASLATAMAERHPHLVVVAVTPFGVEGPWAGVPSTELVAQCLAGVVYRSGVAELPPVSAPGSYCEDVGATVAALASLLALRQARADGHGQVIDVSTVLALAQCTDTSLPLWSLLRADQTRNGAGLYPLFPALDGLVRVVLPMSAGEWRNLIAWLGSPPEWSGPAWDKTMLGPDERLLVMDALAARISTGTREELTADGDAAGVRITPVLTPAEILVNHHVWERGTFLRAPVGDGGPDGAHIAGVFGHDGVRCAVPGPARAADAPPAWAPRPRPHGSPSMGRPLDGVRVLEVGSGVAAPEAGRVLGEWGADVIKIETDRRADFQRRVLGSDMNPAFASPNRNKRSLAADLGTDAGRRMVLDLLAHVDVLVENNATGVIDRLGLGWDEVHARNPRLVVVGTQLYGDRGPWATRKGYGPSARAVGGLTWLWAHGPDEPRGVMTIHPDHFAGRLVALAALAGLHERERTGTGGRFDIAQFEAVAALLGDLFLAESLEPGAALPRGNRSDEHAPWNLYRCADDDRGAETWLAVCVTDDEQWRRLLTVAPPSLDRVAWASATARVADADAVDEAMRHWLRDADAAVIEHDLVRVGVAAGRALHARLQAQHPLFVGRGYAVEVDQPGIGPILLEGPAFTGSRLGSPRCGPAPAIGAHDAAICRELLGLGPDDVRRLVDIGALDPGHAVRSVVVGHDQ
jgi:crotonobetainyl-CoA:carnitine CoA-transferase CaiB-like acyl-CoA transferase